jgi:hypothetical protein
MAVQSPFGASLRKTQARIFFFEKKKQKTFAHLTSRHEAAKAPAPNR